MFHYMSSPNILQKLLTAKYFMCEMKVKYKDTKFTYFNYFKKKLQNFSYIFNRQYIITY